MRECSTHWEQIYSYRGLIRKPEGRRLRGRPRLRWEDVKVDVFIVLINICKRVRISNRQCVL
jgi:hypothetical protein